MRYHKNIPLTHFSFYRFTAFLVTRFPLIRKYITDKHRTSRPSAKRNKTSCWAKIRFAFVSPKVPPSGTCSGAFSLMRDCQHGSWQWNNTQMNPHLIVLPAVSQCPWWFRAPKAVFWMRARSLIRAIRVAYDLRMPRSHGVNVVLSGSAFIF